MSITADFLWAPKVKSGYLEDRSMTVYWVNGTAKEHASLMTLMGQRGKSQEALQRAVYAFACDENGKPLYRGTEISYEQYSAKIDNTATRNFGMMIMGLAKSEDGPMDFDEEAKDHVKKSGKEKGDSSS